MIPFFVVDRPVSLEILKGFFSNFPQKKIGLLTHAFVSDNFKMYFKSFPKNTKLKYSYKSNISVNKSLQNNIIKLGDSGIFQSGKNISYDELFRRYDEDLGVDYGIIIDFLKDKKKTIQSAKKAFTIHQQKYKNKFKLVGVAQGNDIKEYLKCYEELLDIGYKYIALGGLLKRNGDSNYISLSSEKFLKDLFKELKKNFRINWSYTLGIYNPSRHILLQSLNIWGADYKGWLFNYEEDYSFIFDYLLENKLMIKQKDKPILKKRLEMFITLKKNHLISYNDKNGRATLTRVRQIRNSLDYLLNENGTCLQELRFKRISENLRKKLSIYLKN